MNNTEHLMTSLNINQMKLPNRIVMPAMVTNYARADGVVTSRLIDYYVERARGGVSLIITEGAFPHSSGRGFPSMLGAADEKHETGLYKLTEAVHDAGGKIALQLLHMGRRAASKFTGHQPYGPSPVPAFGGELPKEATKSEIKMLIDSFVQGAVRAKKTGFDAVEIHVAHGYLLNQFVSPAINYRTDEYGGNVNNRARIVEEIIKGVREEVGDDYPVLLKLNGDDYVPDGLKPEESASLAKLFEMAGVDAITVSGGIAQSGHMIVQPSAVSQGCHLKAAEKIHAAVDIPVAPVGRINQVELAEKILAEKKADFICMGRALIADHQMPNKVKDGLVDQARPCIACMKGCSERLHMGIPITCALNALAGREKSVPVKKSKVSKNVFIAGGGISGMEAARVCAERGHNVFLYESEKTLGGQANIASLPPFKEEIKLFVTWLEKELQRLGVNVFCNKKVDENILNDNENTIDHFIVAAGAKPALLTNIDEAAKEKGIEVIDAWSVLKSSDVSEKKIVIIGGGMVGCETAEHLVDLGNEVSVVEMLSGLAQDMEPRGRQLLLSRIRDKGVHIVNNASFLKVDDEGIVLDRKGVKEIISGMDMIVTSLGSKERTELVSTLKDKGIGYSIIGDALEPRNILSAVHEAYDLAVKL